MASPIVFHRNVRLTDAQTGGQTSTVGEPSLAANGADVFLTGNWYAARSGDGGGTWTAVDPFTALPPVDDGFCCDQTVTFAPAPGVVVWLLQYPVLGNANTLRIAVHTAPGLANAGWQFWDLKPAEIDPSWSGQWFDYNHAAVSNQFLYVGTNMFTVAGDNWTRAVVFRVPLAGLQAGGALSFDLFESTENFSLRCAQGTTGTMYIVSHNSLEQIRVFTWPENTGDVTATDVNVTAWNAGSYSAPGPDGKNWLSRCDPRITGVWLSRGELGVMWSANRQPPDRPLPFVRVVRLNEATLSVIDEPDLFNAGHAFAYPDVYPNAAGDVGITVFRGGGTVHPGHVVGFLDPGTGAWRLRVSRNGTNGPNDGKWGDYLTCRRHHPDANTWVAAGYTLQGGGNRTDIEPRFVHFGRKLVV